MGATCTACNGKGSRAYGTTATWKGGIGGAAVMSGTCDRCWGTGDTENPGPNGHALRNGSIAETIKLYRAWEDLRAENARLRSFVDAYDRAEAISDLVYVAELRDARAALDAKEG